MDASILDYSYINLNAMSFEKVTTAAMNNAVRVRLAVKEKLGKILSSINSAVESNQVVVEQPKNEQNNDVAESEETIRLLNDKINELLIQGKVETHARNVVLYTMALKDKTIRNFHRKFNIVSPVKEEPVQNAGVVKEDDNSSLNFDLSSLNQEINQSTNVPSFETTLNETQQVIESSGMEIPDTWDKLPDAMISTFTGIEEPKELPKTEPVVESTNAGISSELDSNNNEIPNFYSDELPKTEPVAESTNAGISSELDSDNNEIPNFYSEELPKIEPVSIAEEMNRPIATTPRIEVPISVNQEKTVNEEPQEGMDFSSSSVIAKVQKASNQLKETRVENESLKQKLEDMSEKYRISKEQKDGYEEVIKDLTIKLNNAMHEKELIQQKNGELEANYKGSIMALENTIKQLKQARSIDAEKFRKESADLKAKQEKEIERLNSEYADKIREIESLHNKKLNAVYATISEVLGDSQETLKNVA